MEINEILITNARHDNKEEMRANYLKTRLNKTLYNIVSHQNTFLTDVSSKKLSTP